VEGEHKVVVFSQWETMLHKAAEVLERLGIGYAMLHGSVPGKERRGLLERFRDDPACRVFLSTDAGGTGLNLQTADTVINLEVPWNPAVLEQRIARVHRMGQHRAVRVITLVTRASIEERVLKTLAQKRSLFDGVFSGTSDEVSFAALGQQPFLETVRGLVAEEEVQLPAAPPRLPEIDAHQALVKAGVELLEAVAGLLTAARHLEKSNTATLAGGAGEGAPPAAEVLAGLLGSDPRTGQPMLQLPLPPPELLQRGAAALQTIVRGINAGTAGRGMSDAGGDCA
jgi:hypothetical protein